MTRKEAYDIIFQAIINLDGTHLAWAIEDEINETLNKLPLTLKEENNGND